MTADNTTPKPKNYSRIFAKLSANLPSEAIEAVAGKEFSSIKHAFIIERLNDVLGPNNWTAKYHECTSKMLSTNEIALKCIVTSNKYGLYAEGYGSNSDPEDIGNAYKGAKSVALKNAVLQWGLGLDVHKGLPDENFNALDIPPAERIKKSKNQKFIWTSVNGIITESQEDDKFLWLGINGYTCRAIVPISDELRDRLGAKCFSQGYWDLIGDTRFVQLTRLIGVYEIEPLIVPQAKKAAEAKA